MNNLQNGSPGKQSTRQADSKAPPDIHPGGLFCVQGRAAMGGIFFKSMIEERRAQFMLATIGNEIGETSRQ
jgi:hypothetical protein